MSSKEKRDTHVSLSAKESLLNLRCGDCLHFKGSAHPAIGTACSLLGVKAYAAAPSCYTANVSVFRKTGVSVFASLASIISTFSPQQSRVLMGLLKSAGSLEKFGFTFAQKVYFRIGEDYLDNYFSGHVLGVGVDNNISLVGLSYFSSSKMQVIASVFKSSILSVEEFKARKKKLIDSGRLYAPRLPKKNDLKQGVDYEPPTIETSQELLEQLAAKTRKSMKKKGKIRTLEIKLKKPKKKKNESEDDLDEEELVEEGDDS